MKTLASRLKDRVRIERPVASTSFKGAGSGTWQLVDEVAAEVQDILPSRAERLSEGINIATRPARVMIRPRSDVTSAMRLVMGAKLVGGVVDYSSARIMQIVAGPALNQSLHAHEYIVEESTSAGGGA